MSAVNPPCQPTMTGNVAQTLVKMMFNYYRFVLEVRRLQALLVYVYIRILVSRLDAAHHIW